MRGWACCISVWQAAPHCTSFSLCIKSADPGNPKGLSYGSSFSRLWIFSCAYSYYPGRIHQQETSSDGLRNVPATFLGAASATAGATERSCNTLGVLESTNHEKRPMERPAVEKLLRVFQRGVRFGACVSLPEKRKIEDRAKHTGYHTRL